MTRRAWLVRRFVWFGFVLAVAGSIAGTAGVLEARTKLEARLHGSYAFTTTRTCTNSNMPFESVAQPLGSNFSIPDGASVNRSVSSDEGIRTYNGDGTGTTTGISRSMRIEVGAGAIPMSISNFTGTFMYTVDPDGTVTRTGGGVQFETIAGSSGTVTGGVARDQLSLDNRTLVRAPQEEILVETVEGTTFGGTPFTVHRICVRSSVQTLVGP